MIERRQQAVQQPKQRWTSARQEWCVSYSAVETKQVVLLGSASEVKNKAWLGCYLLLSTNSSSGTNRHSKKLWIWERTEHVWSSSALPLLVLSQQEPVITTSQYSTLKIFALTPIGWLFPTIIDSQSALHRNIKMSQYKCVTPGAMVWRSTMCLAHKRTI